MHTLDKIMKAKVLGEVQDALEMLGEVIMIIVIS